ncbi:MAG: hypothetical protein OEQ53_16595, partial [Saprospiraceae bacterium]|nr:hypothetical protein [Saprospiraceae bacterium]
MLLTLSFGTNGISQTEGPNCTNVNAAVEADGYATVVAGDFIINADDATAFDITVENQWGGIIKYYPGSDPDTEITLDACNYLSQELKLVVKNGLGTCWSKLTFKQDNPPIIIGTSVTVLCDDPLVSGGRIIPGLPTAAVPCEGTLPTEFVADWVVPYPCELGNDTAKIIYREYEAKDKNGVRGTGWDTIVVFRFPEITPDNLYCVEKDTTYCGVGLFQGPYIVVFDPRLNTCRNVNLINLVTGQPAVFDPKCGIQVGIAPPDEFNNPCDEITKYVVDIKQTCYGQPSQCDAVPANAQNAERLGDGYWRCTFWWIDLDTMAPTVTCVTDGFADVVDNVITVPTSSHDCVAHINLPPAEASDICRNVKSVKAIVEGFGTFKLELVGDQWVSDALIKIPYSEDPTKIIYEAIDDCHNIGKDSCYVQVKDRTRPVAVCDKGVNVSLTDKKVWVYAETFDEGSWDNCHINLMLARRSDWMTSCVDLNDGLALFRSFEHYGSIYTSNLSTDKTEEPVEAHYQKQRDWLTADGQACGDLISQAWRYGIMKYATVDLLGSMDLETFDHVTETEYIFGQHDFDQVKQIGGGWSDAVPFECADACGPVTVELLVVDYWCNWSKCWTDVWVEDKTPVNVEKDVVDYVDITCKSYKSKDYLIDGELHPQSIEDLATRADAGDAAAFDKLDEIFGGYRKAWRDPYGNYVDEAGVELDCDIVFNDSTCVCFPASSTRLEYDDHFGWVEVTEESRDCQYDEDPMELNHGVVVVNCPENVHCEQDLWFNFDHCGQGKLVRRFKIWQGCPSSAAGHIPDTIFRFQTISVANECALDEGMFTFPNDTTVDMCEVEYDQLGSGNVSGSADPDITGRPEYIFDDDCRLVGIGYYDKVFRIVGGDEACYKVLRTWCFTDWCEITNGEKQVGNWWDDPEYAGRIFKHVQKIILRDTVPPVVTIVEPAEGPAFEVAGCEFNFSTSATVADECGVLSYRWEILDIKADPVSVASGEGSLNMDMADIFNIIPDNPLEPGLYKLKVIVVDDCQNEGLDTYEFSVVSSKKPTPVCMTSITVELTPMELNDGDTDPDTAMGTVWAEEYNSSSFGACDGGAVTYRIDDGTGAP